MFTILKSAASGLLAQKYNLDVIANNIANVSTTGYKKARTTFADAAYKTIPAGALPAGGPTNEFRAGTGVTLAAAQKMFFPGSLTETNGVWDLAIGGEGFFQVALPDGRKAYTRDGSFRVDGEGRLTTASGLLVDPPVNIPADAEDVHVDASGVIRGSLNGQLVELGDIVVATFPNPDGMLAIGQNLYLPSEASGEARVGHAGTEGRGQILSGVLENSNVDLAEEMTRAIEAQRAYQLSVKALQTADEMLGLANNLRR